MPRIMVEISKKTCHKLVLYNWLKRLTVTRGGAFRQFHKYDNCRIICRLQWNGLVWLFKNYWQVWQPFLCYVCWCLFSDWARQTGLSVKRIFVSKSTTTFRLLFKIVIISWKEAWLSFFEFWIFIGGWKIYKSRDPSSLLPPSSWELGSSVGSGQGVLDSSTRSSSPFGQ